MKFLYTILFAFVSLASCAQGINEQFLGTTQNLVRVRGKLAVDSALILPGDTMKNAPVNSLATKNGILYLKSVAGWRQAVDTTLAKTFRITFHPTNLTKQVGQSATFSVIVAGGKPPYKFQWQKAITNRTGDTLPSFTIPTTALSDTGNFRVRIADSTGTFIYSNYANLSVLSTGGSGGGGSGTVQSFSANDAAPLFTTTETNATTNPVLNFFLTPTNSFTVFGRTVGTGTPTYVTLDTTFISAFATKVRSLFSAGSNVTYNPLTGTISSTGGGGSSNTTTSNRFTGNGNTTPLDVASSTDYQILAAIKLRGYGDSMTYGTGGTSTDQDPGGIPYLAHLQAATGFDYYNYGNPGESSTQIKDRLVADSAKKALPTIIWAGTNDINSPATVKANIATMVAALGHTRYIIIGLLGQNSSTYYSGTGSYNNLVALNSDLAATYGGRFLDIRPSFIAAYNPSLPGDVTAHTNDVWPPSLGSDPTHLNDAGYRLVSTLLLPKIPFLNMTAADSRIVTTANVKALRDSSQIGKFKFLAINGAPVEGDYVQDAQGVFKRTVASINGGVKITYPGSNDGIYIRPGYLDEGGSSNLEILGTNNTYWPSRSGLRIPNHKREFNFGSPVTVEGDLSSNASINAINGNFSGSVASPTITTINNNVASKAPIADPVFIGTPKIGSDTVASRAYARAVGGGSGGGSAILYGTTGNNSDGAMTQAATTSALNTKAPLADPTFTGTPKIGSDTVATKAYARSLMSSSGGTTTGQISADSVNDGTTKKSYTATERTKLSGIATGATANQTDAYLLNRTNHTGTESADVITDGTTNKAYTATEKTKLAGVATGATANSTDATLLNRANHTGSQAQSTVTNLTSDLAAKAPLADPTFTGVPKISTDTIATRAYARAQGGSGGGVTQAQVGQQIADTLNANTKTIRNGAKPAYDVPFKISGNTIIGKNYAFAAANSSIIVDTISYGDTAKLYLFSAAPQRGPKWRPITATSSTVNLSDGYWQVLKVTTTANATITLPTSGDATSLYLQIDNTTNFTISFNVPVYENPSSPISAGATAIGSLGVAYLNFDDATGRYYMTTVR